MVTTHLHLAATLKLLYEGAGRLEGDVSVDHYFLPFVLLPQHRLVPPHHRHYPCLGNLQGPCVRVGRHTMLISLGYTKPPYLHTY